MMHFSASLLWVLSLSFLACPSYGETPSTATEQWQKIVSSCQDELNIQGVRNRLASEILVICAKVLSLEQRIVILSDLPQKKTDQTFPAENKNSIAKNPFTQKTEPDFVNRQEALSNKLLPELEQIKTQTHEYCERLTQKRKTILAEKYRGKDPTARALYNSLPMIYAKAQTFCETLDTLYSELNKKNTPTSVEPIQPNAAPQNP